MGRKRSTEDTEDMMIFSNGLDDKVRDGTKTQTRRLVKSGDSYVAGYFDGVIYRVERNGKRKWRTGRTYAIQPKRGKKGNGRFRITNIRIEPLQAITEADAIAEGVRKLYRCPQWLPGEAIKSFIELWDSIHKKPGTRWEDNPEVWVLEIEYVGSL